MAGRVRVRGGLATADDRDCPDFAKREGRAADSD
jgi:hypothetical protein